MGWDASNQGEISILALSTRFRALKHRNFQLFTIGQLISLIGTWMQTTAQQWLVYRLTKSVALLGIFGFASQVPMLLLAWMGGYMGDRYNRHRGVIVTQTCSMILAFVLAVLTLTHDLIALRRAHPDLHSGSYRSVPAPEGVWAWARGADFTVVVNTTGAEQTVTPITGRIEIAGDRRRDGEAVNGPLYLAPYDACVIANTTPLLEYTSQ